MRSAVLLVLLVGSIAPAGAGEGAKPALLGASDFSPSTEQPFGWRGDGTGRFPAATPVLEWSLTKNVRWSAAVGQSYSSPVLAGTSIIVTSEPDLVLCLDRATGKERWKTRVTPADLTDPAAKTAAEEYKAKDTGFAAATPVTDGSTVYVAFANGILRAFGLDGKPKWITYIDAKQNTSYGRSSSPILTAGKLVLHMTNLYAFDPATGKQLWVNTDSRCTYGTPVGLRFEGADLIVTPNGDLIKAADGTSVNSQIGACSNCSPVVHNGLIYFSEKDVRAIKLTAGFKDESVWNAEIPGEVFGSPLLHDGFLMTVSSKGELIAYDAQKKGELKSEFEGRLLFGEEVGTTPVAYSSLTLAGKHMFLVSNQGEIVVLEATREAKQVAKNKLKDGSGSAPIFSGGDMFVRDGATLFCIGSK